MVIVIVNGFYRTVDDLMWDSMLEYVF